MTFRTLGGCARGELATSCRMEAFRKCPLRYVGSAFTAASQSLAGPLLSWARVDFFAPTYVVFFKLSHLFSKLCESEKYPKLSKIRRLNNKNNEIPENCNSQRGQNWLEVLPHPLASFWCSTPSLCFMHWVSWQYEQSIQIAYHTTRVKHSQKCNRTVSCPFFNFNFNFWNPTLVTTIHDLRCNATLKKYAVENAKIHTAYPNTESQKKYLLSKCSSL